MKCLIPTIFFILLTPSTPSAAWEADGFKSGMSEAEVSAEATVRNIVLHEWFRAGKTTGLRTPISGSHDIDFQFEFCDGKSSQMSVYRLSGRLEDFAKIVDVEIDRRGHPLFDARIEHDTAKLTAEWSDKKDGIYRVILDRNLTGKISGDESLTRQYRDPELFWRCG